MGAYGLAVVAAFAVAFAVLLSASKTVDAQSSPSLSTSDVTWDGTDVTLTLNIAGLDTNGATPPVTVTWAYIVTIPDDGSDMDTDPQEVVTCETVAEGTTESVIDASASLELGTTYTATAYSVADCAAGDDNANVLATLKFSAPAAAAQISGSPGSSRLVTWDITADTGASPPIGAWPEGKATFRVSGDSTADGVFAVDDSTSISCADGDDCDLDEVTGLVTLRVNIAGDSSRGAIYVQRYTRSGGDFNVIDRDEKTINVSSAAAVARVTITPDPKSIAAASGSDGSELTVTVVDSKGNRLAGRSVNIITTNGTLSDCGDAEFVLGCTEKTTAEGTLTVTLSGANRPGTATVTATSGGVSGSADVVLYGTPKTIEASISEGSLELGDSTFIVVTILDPAGNGVSSINPLIAGGGKAPSGPAADSVPVGVVDDVDKLKANGDVDTPSCSSGTNSKGKCVIQVTATVVPGTPAKNAARGTHTVTVQGPEEIKADSRQVDLNVDVAGPSDSMSHDAPERIDTLTELKVTVTAVDDNGVRVGSVPFLVEQIEGAGSVISSSSSTRDGQASFTFISSTGDGAVTFFVRVGHVTTGNKVNITDTITVQVGDAMEEPDEPAMPEEPEEPAMPEAASLSGSGALRIFSGGSVADLGAAAEAACPGGADIWLQDGDGTWQRYSTSRPAFTNAPFNAAFADGFDGATAVFVSSCEADAMEDEG